MARRPRFIRSDTFVVCKPIRITATQRIEVGTEISLETHRLSQLKRWWRRRRIARAGCEWAKNVMAGKRGASVMPKPKESLRGSFEFPAQIEITPGVSVALADLVAEAHVLSGLSTGDWNDLSDEDRSTRIGEALRLRREGYATKIRVERSGSWFTVYRGDEELAKLQGQAALDEWVKEHGVDDEL